jgi:hypothetical protein
MFCRVIFTVTAHCYDRKRAGEIPITIRTQEIKRQIWDKVSLDTLSAVIVSCHLLGSHSCLTEEILVSYRFTSTWLLPWHAVCCVCLSIHVLRTNPFGFSCDQPLHLHWLPLRCLIRKRKWTLVTEKGVSVSPSEASLMTQMLSWWLWSLPTSFKITEVDEKEKSG